MQSNCRQGPPLGWPLARRLPRPTQPWYAQSVLGQKWVEVSTWRRRPRVGTMCGGGGAGGCGCGAPLCSQASQGRVWGGVFVEGGHTASDAVDWKNAACEHSLPQRVRYVGCHAS